MTAAKAALAEQGLGCRAAAARSFGGGEPARDRRLHAGSRRARGRSPGGGGASGRRFPRLASEARRRARALGPDPPRQWRARQGRRGSAGGAGTRTRAWRHPALFESIATARDASDVDHHLAVIDRGLVAARATGPTAEMLRSRPRPSSSWSPGPDWTRDARQAKIAYFHHATDLASAAAQLRPAPDRDLVRFRLRHLAEADPGVRPGTVGARCRLRIRRFRDGLPDRRRDGVHRAGPGDGARQQSRQEQAPPQVGRHGGDPARHRRCPSGNPAGSGVLGGHRPSTRPSTPSPCTTSPSTCSGWRRCSPG